MNEELKRYCASRGVRLWEVAEKFGISSCYFSVKMRKKFDDESAAKFRRFVDEIARGR